MRSRAVGSSWAAGVGTSPWTPASAVQRDRRQPYHRFPVAPFHSPGVTADGGTASIAAVFRRPRMTDRSRHRRPGAARAGGRAWVRPVALVVSCLVIGFVGGWVLRGDDGPATVLAPQRPGRPAEARRHDAGRRRPPQPAPRPRRRRDDHRDRAPPAPPAGPRRDHARGAERRPTPPGSPAHDRRRGRGPRLRGRHGRQRPHRRPRPTIVYYRAGPARRPPQRVATRPRRSTRCSQLPGLRRAGGGRARRRPGGPGPRARVAPRVRRSGRTLAIGVRVPAVRLDLARDPRRSPSAPSGSASTGSGSTTTSSRRGGSRPSPPSTPSPRWRRWRPLTERARLGVAVLSASYRPAPLAAKMATILDVISGGRLIVGLGTGSDVPEHRAYGVPFAPPGERTAGLRGRARGDAGDVRPPRGRRRRGRARRRAEPAAAGPARRAADLARRPPAAPAAPGRRARRRHRGGLRRRRRRWRGGWPWPRRRARPPAGRRCAAPSTPSRCRCPRRREAEAWLARRGRGARHDARPGCCAGCAAPASSAPPDELRDDAGGARGGGRHRRGPGAALARPARGARRAGRGRPAGAAPPPPAPAAPRGRAGDNLVELLVERHAEGGLGDAPAAVDDAGRVDVRRALGGVGAGGRRPARGRRPAAATGWRSPCATGAPGWRPSSARPALGAVPVPVDPAAGAERLADPARRLRAGGRGRPRTTRRPPGARAVAPGDADGRRARARRRRCTRRTSPTSSTPRARPAGPRARCTRTATCASASRPTPREVLGLAPGRPLPLDGAPVHVARLRQRLLPRARDGAPRRC